MLRLFTWGYEGWGNSTKELVQAFSAVEEARGFEPPLFVDIRARRQVRALGFLDDAFERLLGRERYRWMPGLGNEKVLTGEGRMRLVAPGDCFELLGLALAQAESRRRVLFFCSCHSPGAADSCHRTLVREGLLKAARRINQSITVQEWPGGALPARVLARVNVAPKALTDVRRGRDTVALGKRKPPTALLSLPHGAIVRLEAGVDSQLVSVSPARSRGGEWHLPVFLFPVDEGDSIRVLHPPAERRRKKDGLEAFTSR